MKPYPVRSFFIHTVAGLMFAGLFGSSSMKAATETWNGGDGTWDVGTTPSWNGGTATWTNLNDANFGSGTGTVTVDNQGGAAPVFFDQVSVNDNSGGTGYTFTGATLTTGNNNTPISVGAGNTADATFGAINVNETDHSVGDQSNFSNSSTSTLTLGAINVQDGTSQGFANQFLSFNQAAGGKIVLAGPITTSGPHTALFLGINGPSSVTGTYEISGSVANGIQINMFRAGTLLLGTSNLGDQTINNLGFDYVNPISILTDGPQNISNAIGTQNDMKLNVGGTKAGTSNFNGAINIFAQLSLVTANGGRVNFNNAVGGQIGTGLTTSGSGTIALNNAGGNSYGTQYRPAGFSEGTVAATLGATLTLINNNAGTEAFGGGSAHTVNLLANSGLGGKGSTAENVVAADSSSVIAPGDGSSIATLTLAGGLNAANGLTMDFKLNGDASNAGVNNDLIDVANLTLSGTVTINVTNLGTTVDTTAPYALMFGSGTWTDDGATFVINAPTGYTDDLTYGADQGTPGYIFDNSGDNSFSIRFAATPEPSTYGLMGLGLLALISVDRWMRRGSAV